MATIFPLKAKAQMASGQGSHKSPTVFQLCVTGPPEIFVSFVFTDLFMLLAFTQSVDNLFS